MTTLGEILGQLQDREEIYGLLLESGNAGLVGKLDEKAHATSDDPCGVALKAVHAFRALLAFVVQAAAIEHRLEPVAGRQAPQARVDLVEHALWRRRVDRFDQFQNALCFVHGALT